MQVITHYVRPDNSEAHHKMLPVCGQSENEDKVTIVPEFVNCKPCRNTNEFKTDRFEDD